MVFIRNADEVENNRVNRRRKELFIVNGWKNEISLGVPSVITTRNRERRTADGRGTRREYGALYIVSVGIITSLRDIPSSLAWQRGPSIAYHLIGNSRPSPPIASSDVLMDLSFLTTGQELHA